MQTPAIINNMQTSFPDQGLLSQNQQIRYMYYMHPLTGQEVQTDSSQL